MRLRNKNVNKVTSFLTAAFIIFSANTAEAKTYPNRTETLPTGDGLVLKLTQSRINVRTIPNAAGAVTSAEALITAKSSATIGGKNRKRVKGATVEYGIQMGCAVDVSDGATLGLAMELEPTVGVTGNVGVSGELANAFPITGAIGAMEGVTVGTTPAGKVAGNVSVSPKAEVRANFNPSIYMHIKPGKVNVIVLAKKEMALTRAIINTKNLRVGLDGCLGSTSLRLYTTLYSSTALSDDVLTVYSPTIYL